MGGTVSHKLSEDDIKFILNELRKASVRWPGRSQCLKRHRKKVLVGLTKKGKKKYKYHWQCNKCKNWVKHENEVEVDHIDEIGPFKGSFDKHIPRIFCAQSNLQCLCISCHQKKTDEYARSRINWVRKSPR